MLIYSVTFFSLPLSLFKFCFAQQLSFFLNTPFEFHLPEWFFVVHDTSSLFWDFAIACKFIHCDTRMHSPYWKTRQVSGKQVRHPQCEATIKIYILEIPNLTHHIAKIILIIKITVLPMFSSEYQTLKKKCLLPSTVTTLTPVLHVAMFIYFLIDCISYTLIKIPSSMLNCIPTFENTVSFELFHKDFLIFLFLFLILCFTITFFSSRFGFPCTKIHCCLY